jgi:hypothetical protein
MNGVAEGEPNGIEHAKFQNMERTIENQTGDSYNTNNGHTSYEAMNSHHL